MTKDKSSIADKRGRATPRVAIPARRREPAKHPRVPEQVADYTGNADAKAWMKSLGFSDEEVERYFNALIEYLGGDYESIHNGLKPEITKILDEYMARKEVPITDADIYRGAYLESAADLGMPPEQYVEWAIKQGKWVEPGVSSFSTDEDVARRFAKTFMTDGSPTYMKPNGARSVILHIAAGKNKSGTPVQHISKFGSGEAEVLMPSGGSSNNGSKEFKIVSYTKTKGTYILEVEEF